MNDFVTMDVYLRQKMEGTCMFIDLHMHEKNYSLDSHLSLEEMVAIAKKRGLDAICITDHDSMGLKENMPSILANTSSFISKSDRSSSQKSILTSQRNYFISQ